MSHATHSNAVLTPRTRLKLARLILEEGWPIPRAAERYDVSWRTAKKWAEPYRLEGEAGMFDRSPEPHHQPNRTRVRVVKKIVDLRIRLRLRPVEIADRLGMASSSTHAVLVGCRLNRLTHLDRIIGEPIRHYERRRPEGPLHMAVERLDKIPTGVVGAMSDTN